MTERPDGEAADDAAGGTPDDPAGGTSDAPEAPAEKAGEAAGEGGAGAPGDEALSTLLDSHLRPLLDAARVPAVAAAAIRGDDEALLAIGLSRRGCPDPVDTTTAFQIGSISTTYTTLLLAEMAESGEVGYADPIDVHLPPAARPHRHGPVTADPPETQPITLIELATHSGGLPRLPRNLFPRALLRWRSDPYGGYTRDDLYRATAGLRLTPAADRVPRYSTFGVGLLGQLLADTAGVPYPWLLADRILRPLRMTDTYAPIRPSTSPYGGGRGAAPDRGPGIRGGPSGGGPSGGRRSGGRPSGGRPSGGASAESESGRAGRAAEMASGHRRGRPVAPWTFDALAGAGAVRSSAADMCRYLRAHLYPRSVPGPLGRALAVTHTPRHHLSGRAGGGAASVTLGWNHRAVRGHDLLWHTGATGGFTAFAGFSPTAGTGVVVLVNAAVGREQPVIRAARRLFRAATFGDP
jgi:D-alanyl-D-alanine-carboxypeptidase/D-alanyl-D-alanine-endopeptidase